MRLLLFEAKNMESSLRFITVAICIAKALSMTGMGFNNMDNWPTSGLNNVRIWDIGATWRDIHLNIDTYDWSRLDAIVDQIQYVGASATYVIGATPQWLAKYPDQCCYAEWLGPGSNSMPWSVDEFTKFVDQLSARYAGRISAYEIWNEPQLSDFLYPYDDAELNCLATMTSSAYASIKAHDPGASVLAASVLPRASSGGMSKASSYLSAMQSHGWNIDAFTTHIYPDIGEGADAWNNMLADAKNSIASFGPPTTAIWVTETNYNLLGPVIPEEEAPGLINSTYSYAASQAVSQIHWYGWDTTASLGGLNINHDTTAWAEIQNHHE